MTGVFMQNIKVNVEYLSNTNTLDIQKPTSVSCESKKTAELTALALVQSGTFEKNFMDMGDVLHLDNKIFLVEADQTVTEIEQNEYAYYKNIDDKDRIAQWFGGSIN